MLNHPNLKVCYLIRDSIETITEPVGLQQAAELVATLDNELRTATPLQIADFLHDLMRSKGAEGFTLYFLKSPGDICVLQLELERWVMVALEADGRHKQFAIRANDTIHVYNSTTNITYTFDFQPGGTVITGTKKPVAGELH